MFVMLAHVEQLPPLYRESQQHVNKSLLTQKYKETYNFASISQIYLEVPYFL